LLIPFDALTGFFDPSVQFGLKFTVEGMEDESAAEPPAGASAPGRSATRGAASEPVELQPKMPPAPVAAPKVPAKPKEKPAEAPAVKAERAGKKKPEGEAEAPAQVVSLDAFRKKS
jgi:hypothetical protein